MLLTWAEFLTSHLEMKGTQSHYHSPQAILCPLFEEILNPRYVLFPCKALLLDSAEIAARPVALGKCNLVTFEFISCCVCRCDE